MPITTNGRDAAFVLRLARTALLTTWSVAHAPLAAQDPMAPPLSIVHYDLDWIPDFEAATLKGNCSITLRANAESTTVPLYLYRTLTVTSVTDAAGNDLVFTQHVTSLADWPQRQINSVEVRLERPLPPLQTTTLRIRYRGHLLGYTELGMSYVKDRISKDFTILRSDCDAYPQLLWSDWQTTNQRLLATSFGYRVALSVPAPTTVANGGKLVGKTTTGATTTWIYEHGKPSWRMDFAIGRYVVLEGAGARVFAFVDDEAGGKRVLDAVERTLRLYGEMFGPLRDASTFAVIEIPDDQGSQADVTSIVQTAAAFRDPDNLVEVYHEIAHQWNVRALERAPSRVESEGFAMFLQYFAAEKLTGKPGTMRAGVDRLIAGARRRLQNNEAAAAVPMARYGEERLTDFAYTKGGVFFALLHERLGDADFNAIIGRHYRQFSGPGATLQDFVQSCRAVCGDRADRLFDDWLFGSKSSQFFRDGLTFDQMLGQYR